MSCLRFHFFEAVLRHAWLNLWVKRMTTGRINQIALKNVRKRIFNLHPMHSKISSAVRKHFNPKVKNVCFKFQQIVFCKTNWKWKQVSLQSAPALNENWVRQVHSQSSFNSKIWCFLQSKRHFATEKATKPTRKRLWTAYGHGSMLPYTSNNQRHSSIRF